MAEAEKVPNPDVIQRVDQRLNKPKRVEDMHGARHWDPQKQEWIVIPSTRD